MPLRDRLAAFPTPAAGLALGLASLAWLWQAEFPAAAGLRAEAFPAKGIYYLGGLTEGFETILFFALICLFPAAFAPLAYGFAALCGLTTVSRWGMGWRAFDRRD